MSKLLGIIGGMGTQATAYLYEILHELQCVTVEQEYIDVLLYSKPSIPDRTAYITGQSTENPLEPLISAALILENAGVDCIVIPCATSHYFYDDLVKAVSVPILNLLDATALYVKEIGSKSVCLLATDGTIKSRLFHDALEKIGIEVVTPSDSVQADLMEIIYDIKRGEAVSPEALYSIAAKACGDDIDAVILGCTELCVLTDGTKKTDEPSPCLPSTPVLINILDVLAEASIAFCRSGNERN